MKEVQIAHDKMDTDRTGEPGDAHYRNNLNQTPIELRTSSHEQEQTADRAQSSAETGPIMGNNGDQRGRNSSQGLRVQADKS